MAIKDTLHNKFDIYYLNSSSTPMGFMLARKKGGRAWERRGESSLPVNYAPEDISYANLSPDVQKVLAHRYFHGGLGAIEYEVEDDAEFQTLRYKKTQNIDCRCRGKIYPGPKMTTITPPTIPAFSIFNGSCEAETGWTNGERSNDVAYKGTYSWKVGNAVYATQAIVAWSNNLRGAVIKITAWCRGSVATAGNLQVYDGVDTTISTNVPDGSWGARTVVHRFNAAATECTIKLYGGTTVGGYSYFDEIKISYCPTDGATPRKGWAEFNDRLYIARGNILLMSDASITAFTPVYSFPDTIASLEVYAGQLLVSVYNPTVLESCESAWTAKTNVTATADSSDLKTGSYSAKLVIAAGHTTGLAATHDFSATDLSKYTGLRFWAKSSIALSAGDYEIVLDDTAACASVLENLDIPALSANVWTLVDVKFATPANLNNVISIGLNVAVDKGAATIYLDDFRLMNAYWYISSSNYGTESTATDPFFQYFKKAANTLWGNRAANSLASTTDPTNAGTWGSAITCGEESSEINDLQEHDGTLHVMKDDGIVYYYSSSSTAFYATFAELSALFDADAGKNSVVSRDGLYFRDGDRKEFEIKNGVLTEITPELSAVGMSEYAYECVAHASDQTWLYAIMKEAANKHHILAGRWETIAGATRWLWHDIRYFTTLTDVSCAFVSALSGRQYLYIFSTVSTENIQVAYVPNTVDATADAGYRFHTAGSLWSPRYMTQLFMATKRWQQLVVRSLNLSATNYITASYSTNDGSSFTAHGTNLTTSPDQTLSFTAFESAMLNLKLDFVGDSETTPPVLKYYLAKGLVIYDSKETFVHTIRCAEHLLLKKNIESDPGYTYKAIRDFVDGMRDTVCTLGDVFGDEHTVRVRVIGEQEVFNEESKQPEMLFTIEALKTIS